MKQLDMFEPQEFAVYRGDDLEFMGTAQECAEHLGVLPETVAWYTTPTARKRQANRKRLGVTVIRVEG